MQQIQDFIVDVINDNYWKVIPWLLLAAGAYFGIRTLLVQIRLFPDMLKMVGEKPKSKSGESLSAFQAFTISAASRVGTGNIVGVAIAITVGTRRGVLDVDDRPRGWRDRIRGIHLGQLFKSRDGKGGYVGGGLLHDPRHERPLVGCHLRRGHHYHLRIRIQRGADQLCS